MKEGKFNEKDNEMVQLTKIILKQTARHRFPLALANTVYVCGPPCDSLQTADAFPVVASLPPTGKAFAVCTEYLLNRLQYLDFDEFLT